MILIFESYSIVPLYLFYKIDDPKEGQGFFHGIPENFPSLSDLVGEFSEKKQQIADGPHMVNYQKNEDGTITAKLEEGRQRY